MNSSWFSRPIYLLIGRSTLALCVLTLPLIWFAPDSHLYHITVRAASPQTVDTIYTCTEIDESSIGAAGRSDRFWKNKRELRVQFLGGSETLQGKVRHYASIWNDYTNIPFVFVESGPADIRVSFKANGNSWSYIGSGAKSINKDEATMNLGFIEGKAPEDVIRRTVLHEFGHALGLIHEHQSPRAAIHWNKQVVYDYYWEHFKWTEQEVDENIFKKYGRTRTQYTAYDSSSIMHYPIRADFTTDNKGVDWNTNLSEQDIAFIGKIYPRSP